MAKPALISLCVLGSVAASAQRQAIRDIAAEFRVPNPRADVVRVKILRRAASLAGKSVAFEHLAAPAHWGASRSVLLTLKGETVLPPRRFRADHHALSARFRAESRAVASDGELCTASFTRPAWRAARVASPRAVVRRRSSVCELLVESATDGARQHDAPSARKNRAALYSRHIRHPFYPAKRMNSAFGAHS